jgi:hypothetical protein
MAETEETEKPKEDVKEFNKEKIDCTLGLCRFLHLGTYESNFTNSFSLIFNFGSKDLSIYTTIEFLINKLIETDPLAPLNLIKKVIITPRIKFLILDFISSRQFNQKLFILTMQLLLLSSFACAKRKMKISKRKFAKVSPNSF